MKKVVLIAIVIVVVVLLVVAIRSYNLKCGCPEFSAPPCENGELGSELFKIQDSCITSCDRPICLSYS